MVKLLLLCNTHSGRQCNSGLNTPYRSCCMNSTSYSAKIIVAARCNLLTRTRHRDIQTQSSSSSTASGIHPTDTKLWHNRRTVIFHSLNSRSAAQLYEVLVLEAARCELPKRYTVVILSGNLFPQHYIVALHSSHVCS